MNRRYPQLQLDNQLCFALYDASRAITRAYGPVLDELDLTYPQYLTMLVLWEKPDDTFTVGHLGERLHLDSGTLTPLLKRLEQAGLVTRRRDPDDERRVLVTLTTEGLRLREAAAGVPARVFARFGMDLDQARRLRDELVRLVEAVEATGPG
jgi:DNA-binding MarR family transcriptional regulator